MGFEKWGMNDLPVGSSYKDTPHIQLSLTVLSASKLTFCLRIIIYLLRKKLIPYKNKGQIREEHFWLLNGSPSTEWNRNSQGQNLYHLYETVLSYLQSLQSLSQSSWKKMIDIKDFMDLAWVFLFRVKLKAVEEKKRIKSYVYAVIFTTWAKHMSLWAKKISNTWQRNSV